MTKINAIWLKEFRTFWFSFIAYIVIAVFIGTTGWLYFRTLFVMNDANLTGFFAALQPYLVDGYFVNDANTASTQAYELLNLRAGYQVNIGDHWSVAPYVGFNNLANQNYIGTARLNALGGRYFEPAPTFNTYAGIAVIARL